MILLDLIHNIALLVALAAASQVIEARWQMHRLATQVLAGLLFGVVGVVGMMTPVRFLPGVIFDGRSIILSVGGLFGGPVVAGVAAAICGAYRLWLGGTGTAMGLSVIAESAALGVAFYYWRRRWSRQPRMLELWGFGFLVHAIMLGLTILLPGSARQEVWKELGFAIIGVYPVATMLVCRVFLDYEKQRLDRAALLESEQRFRRAFEESPMAYLAHDADGCIRDVNPACLRLFGYTRDEVVGRKLEDFLVPSGRAGFAERFAQYRASGTADGRELAVRSKQGEVLTVAVDGVFVRDAEGRPVRAHCVLQNVTQRKQAEEAIRKYETIFRHAAWGMVITDPPTNAILQANPAFARMHGYTADEMVGMNLADTIPPEMRSELPVLARIVHDKGHHVFESVHQRKDGSRFACLADVTAFKDAEGRVRFRAATFEDITERKRAEELYRAQAMLLDAATDAIFATTLDNTVTYWNAGATRLYGWSAAEARGRGAGDLCLADAATLAAAHAALLAHGFWSGEIASAGKTGREIVALCRWTLVRDDQGRPQQILAINTDVTEKKQLEAQFFRAQRLESIGELAGGIAHDLNNILTPILLSVPLLRVTTAEQRNRTILDAMGTCAQRATDIIRQLLTFARGRPDTREPVAVKQLLEEAEQIIRETFPRNIRVTVAAPGEHWPVLGDATQIHQALLNLCVNARDAMPDGGEIALTAENLTLAEGFTAFGTDAKPGAYLCLSVADTGSGIPAEQMDRIFEPFFTTKEFGRGSGLGLSTVLGIVRGHGGFVRVSSQVGRGSKFDLCFPATPAEAPSSSPGQKAESLRGNGELIVVVDDEVAVREVTRRSLEASGYRVLTATEGGEALELVAQHRDKVRAVLSDMMMPGTDGRALARALRQREPQIPIVAMTGLIERGRPGAPDDLGLAAVIAKPFTPETLLTAIQRALASKPPETVQSGV